jgi:uncharacterized protein (DUF1330 family)
VKTVEIDPEDLVAAAAVFPADSPVVVVNLVQYRAEADYGEHATLPACTGEEAYFERYLPAFNEAVKPFGGCELVFGGRVMARLVGPPVEPHWDAVIVARYPSIAAFQDLVNDPSYKANAKPHRSAAVADCRAFVTTDLI